MLVADDDEAFRQSVCAVFEPFFDLVEARTGREALNVAEKQAIDLAVCDMYMPQLTGLEVLRLWKQTSATRPAILMSGDCTDDLRRRVGLEIDALLEKPFTRRTLLHSVADAIARAYQDHSLERQLRGL
jgi:CheY-like chemotaxis protein